MILVDERVGSRELLQRLRGFGCDADLAHLDAADFQFVGNGDPAVCPSPLIGIERKTIQDLINSMRSKRLAGQQHVRMTQLYDECYLIVEGLWRRGRESGLLEVRNGSWYPARGNVRYAEVDRFLCSLEIMGQVRVRRTTDEEETCAVIADLALWWAKAWHEHSSMKTIYAPAPQRQSRGHRPMMRREANLVEKVLAQLPHIDSRALDIAPYFSSVRDVVEADELRWASIPGARIGKKTAKDIVEAIDGR